MPIPKRPQAPHTKLRPPRLRLAPIRNRESVALDGATTRARGMGHSQIEIPKFQHWPEFYRDFGQAWNADPDYGAEHVVIVGQAGSGKTTLARELLDFQPFVVVLGTKTRDPSLYGPLLAKGYQQTEKFDPTDTKNPKVIFAPTLYEPTPTALAKQSGEFRRALIGIFRTGGWCIYCDEIRYLTETLKLDKELNTLWLQGRSLWVTLVASTQRPVSIPLNAFEQATHSFLFRTTGKEDRIRSSEYQGGNAPVVYETLVRLPHHEFLYVNKTTDYTVRSMVER